MKRWEEGEREQVRLPIEVQLGGPRFSKSQEERQGGYEGKEERTGGKDRGAIWVEPIEKG